MMREAFLAAMLCMIGACAGLLSAPCRAQEALGLEELEAPPPMKYIPQAERARLAAVRETKARTRLSLALIEERLENAERLTTSHHFDGAAAELGIYQALITDALDHLRAASSTANQNRDLYKLMDLTLRAQASRIDAMRRATPFQSATNVRAVYEHVERARTVALNAFYGEQVVTEEEAVPRKKNVRDAAAAAASQSFARLDEAFALLADKSKAQTAIPILIELLKDPDAFVRLDAAYALGFIGPEAHSAVPLLLTLLKDGEAMVRNNAAYALGLIRADADRVVPELVKLIRDRDPRVRFNAAEAIGRFGQAAVPALNKVTQEEK
jgi:HEAT repeat protein